MPTDFDEAAVLVVLDDARVAVAVGDEDVPCGVPGDVGGTARRCTARARCGGGTPSTASGRRPSTIRTRPSGLNLMTMFDAFVHGPDVVLRVDAHRVREREAVEALADLAQVVALGVELEEARGLAARVDEDVSLGIGGDADAFAQVEVGRQLQEIRRRVERDLRNVLCFGAGVELRRRQALRGRLCELGHAQASAAHTRQIFLFISLLLFFDRQIPIHRRIRDALRLAAGLRPLDLHPVDLRGVADAEHLARIVRREIAAAVVLQARSHYAAGRPGDSARRSRRDCTSPLRASGRASGSPAPALILAAARARRRCCRSARRGGRRC